MSSKTSFKRIALVAASALAITGFSAVPANATVPTDAAVSAISTVFVAKGSTVTIPLTITSTSMIGHTFTVTAAKSAGPTASAANVGSEDAGKFTLSSVGAALPFTVNGTTAANGQAPVTHTSGSVLTIAANATEAVAGDLTVSTAKRLWSYQAGGRAGDPSLRRAAHHPAHRLGVFGPWGEFREDHAASQ